MRGSKEREQAYGLEKHFVVNHLGHFILVYNLLERLYLSWQGRVVVVGSRAAYRDAPAEGIEFGNLRGASNYSRSRAYGHSKLANVLFSLELARLLKGTRITSNSLHPGVINTEIDRSEPGFFQFAFGVLTAIGGKSIEQGAATSCYVATSPQLGSTSGKYFEDCNAIGRQSHARRRAGVKVVAGVGDANQGLPRRDSDARIVRLRIRPQKEFEHLRTVW